MKIIIILAIILLVAQLNYDILTMSLSHNQSPRIARISTGRIEIRPEQMSKI